MNYKIVFPENNSEIIQELSLLLHSELESVYGKGRIENFIDENNEMIKFIAVEFQGKIAACGALKHFKNSTAEIKRMYVRKNFRGKGISKLILKALENLAVELNYKRVILETGIYQPEAVALYKKYGYSEINCYGRHADEPDGLCFEKKLSGVTHL